MVQFLIPSPISSELEIYERRNLLRHKLYHQLNGQNEYYKLHNPVYTNKSPLHRDCPFMREEMKHNKGKHHRTPCGTSFYELRNLSPVKVNEDILYYQYGLLEIGCPEKYPEQRYVNKREKPAYKDRKPIVRDFDKNRFESLVYCQADTMHRPPENKFPRCSMP